MAGTSNWVIVAIPSADDYTWKISSEKKPHMTMLFLGEQKKNETKANAISEFLKHVIDYSIPRFGLQVDRRGLLGKDDADVLFFKKNRDVSKLETIRSYLLTNFDIREAYNSTTQHDPWTPHLTLGYPATPAKPDQIGYSNIHWVEFDRVALWTGDYEGPTFELKSRDEYSVAEVAMSDTVDRGRSVVRGNRANIMIRDEVNWDSVDTKKVNELLEHHGVRGMKWGISRNRAQLDAASADFKTTAGHRSTIKDAGGTHVLSNNELQTIITRLNLEQQYGRLTQTPSNLQKGQKIVREILGVGKTIQEVNSFLNGPMGKEVRNHFKK